LSNRVTSKTGRGGRIRGLVHTGFMGTKTTIAIALAAGFLGGVVSEHIAPAPVYAQAPAPAPQEIRVHRLELIDDNGVTRAVLGFARDGNPELQVKWKAGVMTARFNQVILDRNKMLK